MYADRQANPQQAHLRRVAAVSLEIAGRLRLTPPECETLAQAASLHHLPAELLNAKAFERLLADLRAGFPSGGPRCSPTPQARLVVERLHCRRAAPSLELLAQIVEAANFFDERMEFLPIEPMNFDQIIDELEWMSKDGFLDPAVVRALGGLPQVRMDELLEQVHRLPVFPAVLLRALEITTNTESSFSEIERIVASDQVLAGQLLRAANSSLYSPLRRIASIPQAVSYIGLDACRKVMMAAALQPLFSSNSLRDLWAHSLTMARLTERVALLTGRIDPHEAFLAGLVHDVGRLALQKARRDYVADYQRLIELGCEPVFAEMLLCGFEHGAVGGEVLRWWTFPEHLIEAVQHHHRPELGDSLLGAALYLAESCSGSHEDIDSPVRMDLVQNRLGFSFELPDNEGPPGPGWLDFLVSAA